MTQRQASVVGAANTLEPALGAAWRRQRETIAQRFDGLATTCGDDPKTLDYGSRVAQRARFRVLAEALPLNGRRALDVGCGFADFADYLTANYGPVDYEGVDICPRVIEHAQRRHPSLPLRVLDILEEDPGGPFDFVVAHGVFHLLGDGAFELMGALIARMFELSRRAAAFTTLSAWAEHRRPGDFHADPGETLAFCRSLTPRVALRHDYLPYDFAVFLHRGGYAKRSSRFANPRLAAVGGLPPDRG
ncbi:MAG: class I SAM-dependent methyltransferase [Phycisphaerae bacterium]